MTLTQLLIALRSRWPSALITLLAVIALVAAMTALAPRRYTAVAAVVLDVKTPDPLAGAVQTGPPSVSSYMATQADVLRSERVVLGALKSLGLLDDPAQRQRWHEATDGRGEFPAWLADSIARNLDVKPARESNVLTVAYTAADPAFAAKVANAIVDAYTGTTLQLRVDPARQYASFFDERAKVLRDQLEAAQSRLSAYQREKGIIVNDERLDVENARLAELSSQLVQQQAAGDESASRQREAARHGSRTPEVLASPLLSGMTAELARQEAKLSDLDERYGPRYPEVVQLRASIAALRSRIDAETRRVTDSLRVANDVNQSRLAQTRAALEAQRAKLLQLKGQRDEERVLVRDVENAQKAYDTVLARVSQSGLESQATQTNVAVLKRASEPAFASSPRLALNLAAGAALGLLLAIAVAIVRERRDQRLRTLDDVTTLLEQPLLGVLPAPHRQGLVQQARSRLATRSRRRLALAGGH